MEPATRREPDVFDALVAARHDRRACALATVVRTTGSTPRKAAARMLVDEQGAITGTIGGGRIEAEIVAACVALLAEGAAARAKLLRFQLTRELAMCCGGEMEIFIEPLVPEPTLLVLGAGHVAAALVPMARAAGFAPIVIDELEEYASEARFPDAARIVHSFDPQDFGQPLDDRTYAVIVTRDHAVDQRLLEALLGRDLAYLGLIGSRRKIAMFEQRLLAKGFAPGLFARQHGEPEGRLHAPIGLAIGAETPAEIAVAIVAELIQVRAGRRTRQASAARARLEQIA